MQFREWLREKLFRMERKQFEVAEAIGVAETDLSRWKNGKSSPSLESALKIAVYFREDPLSLFEMLNRPDWAELYSQFLAPGERSTPTLFDVLQDRQAVALHTKFQSVVRQGGQKAKVLTELLDLLSSSEPHETEDSPSKKALAS